MSHPLYEVVKRRLREFSSNVESKVFLVSALGWDFCAEPNPAERKVQPCNWFKAIRWAVEQAAALIENTHKQVLDEIEQEITQKGPRRWGWLLPGGGRLLRSLDAADQNFKLSTGPLASRFFALRQRVVSEQQQQRRQWRVRFAACAAAILAVLALGFHSARTARVADYDGYDQLAEERPTESGLQQSWLTTTRRSSQGASTGTGGCTGAARRQVCSCD